jgi:hypothetical protein
VKDAMVAATPKWFHLSVIFKRNVQFKKKNNNNRRRKRHWASYLLFGKQGAIVCVVDINQDQVEETTRLIKVGRRAYGYM